jgi:CxxC motif-containing protein
MEVARSLRQVELVAPVREHQVVLENVLDTQVDIITSRPLNAA